MLFTAHAWHLSTLFILSVIKPIPSPFFCFGSVWEIIPGLRIMDAELLLFALALKADIEKAKKNYKRA